MSTETKTVRAVCHEGRTGAKSHAAHRHYEQTTDLAYRTCGGWRPTMVITMCTGVRNNGVSLNKLNRFVNVNEFSTQNVTCKDCRKALGLE